MAATFTSAGSYGGDPAAFSPDVPAHITDDVQILLVENSGASNVTLTTAEGFTEASGSPIPNSGSRQIRGGIFWRRCTSGSMAAPTIADSGNHQGAQILNFRGVIDTGNPIDVLASNFNTTPSTSHTLPSATTTVDDVLVLLIAFRDNDSDVAEYSGWTNANLDSLTEIVDGGHIQGNGGGWGVAAGIKATAGATGTSTVTTTNSVENVVFTIGLLPGDEPPVTSQIITVT